MQLGLRSAICVRSM